MRNTLGVLGGTALLGGGLALARSRFANRSFEDEQTNPTEEQRVRNVVVTRSRNLKTGIPDDDKAWEVLVSKLNDDTDRISNHLSLMSIFVKRGLVYVPEARGNIKVKTTPDRLQEIAEYLEKTKTRFEAALPNNIDEQNKIRNTISDIENPIKSMQSAVQRQTQ